MAPIVEKRCQDEVSASEESDEGWLETKWKRHEVKSNPSVQSLWPKQNNGIMDLVWQRTDGRRTSEGRKLEHCINCLHRLCSDERPHEFKIGMASDVLLRYHYYRRPESKWKPNLLFLVERPGNREAASFLEAALINYVAHAEISGKCVNIARRDKGGEGPQKESLAMSPYYIYLAFRLLYIRKDTAAAASTSSASAKLSKPCL